MANCSSCGSYIPEGQGRSCSMCYKRGFKIINEFVATFETSYQISETEFQVDTPAMKVYPTTTISEIENFFRSYRCAPMQVTIRQLESKIEMESNHDKIYQK